MATATVHSLGWKYGDLGINWIFMERPESLSQDIGLYMLQWLMPSFWLALAQYTVLRIFAPSVSWTPWLTASTAGLALGLAVRMILIDEIFREVPHEPLFWDAMVLIGCYGPVGFYTGAAQLPVKTGISHIRS